MATEKPTSCRFTELASGPVARIEKCRCCGTLTVHLGAISFRVDAEVLGSLWTTMGEALVRTSGRGDAVDAPSDKHVGRA
jgi:hypothetical protein